MRKRIVAIITKTSLIYDQACFNHEDLINKYGLRDHYLKPKFVRVEVCKDNLVVTQDLLPGWYHPVLLPIIKQELDFIVKYVKNGSLYENVAS